jgi:hypothetical protein
MGKDEGWLICVWMMDVNGKMLYSFYTPRTNVFLSGELGQNITLLWEGATTIRGVFDSNSPDTPPG